MSKRQAIGQMTVTLRRKSRSPDLVPVTLTWRNGPPPEEVVPWQRLDAVKTKGLLGWAPSLAHNGYLVWCGPPLLKPSQPITAPRCAELFVSVEGQARVMWFNEMVTLNMSQRDKGNDKWVRTLRLSTTPELCTSWTRTFGTQQADRLSFLLREGRYPGAWLLTDDVLVLYIKIMAGPLRRWAEPRRQSSLRTPDGEPSLESQPDADLGQDQPED